MWAYSSTTNFGLGFTNQCMCQTTTGPCLCPNPMTNCYNNNSNNLVNYQKPPENITYGFSHANCFVGNCLQEGGDQMATSEMGSWLLSNTDGYRIDHGRSYGGNDQFQGQFVQMQTQTSLLPTVADIVPEATIGGMDLQREWALTHFSFPPFYPANLTEEAVGSYSNSTSISSSLETQQQQQQQLKPSEPIPMSRQDRILRYIEKKKARKYEKKIIHSSRKTFAQTRPRIRGRFARSSQMDDANDKTTV